FHELHTQFLAEAQRLLQPQLRPKYLAKLERHQDSAPKGPDPTPSVADGMRAVADFVQVPHVDLTDVTIPKSVISLVPESIARENTLLPLVKEGGVIKIAMSDPTDFNTIQKLQFVLNKDVCPISSPREQILEAIDRHYGMDQE